MPDSVSSDTIDSLAAKLAAFADALPDDERTALDLFFLQPSDVEGFGMSGLVLRPDGPPIAPAGSPTGFDAAKGTTSRQQYYRYSLENVLITSY